MRLNYFSFILSYIQRIISKNGMLTEIEKDDKINVSYDNYGNIKSIGSKNITYNKISNKLRYYYDIETNLYYCNARYYD